MSIHPEDINGLRKNERSNLRRPGFGWKARGKNKKRKTARYIIQQRRRAMLAIVTKHTTAQTRERYLGSSFCIT